MRNGLVVGQVATALILLTGAGLLMRSFVHLQAFDPGFRVNGALITTVLLPPLHYPSAQAPVAVADALTARLAALPGVDAVAVGTNLPFAGPATRTLDIPGRVWPNGQAPVANNQLVGPAYFHSMGIPLVQGRPFDARDRRDSLPVVIVSASLAAPAVPRRGRRWERPWASVGAGRAPSSAWSGTSAPASGRPRRPCRRTFPSPRAPAPTSP